MERLEVERLSDLLNDLIRSLGLLQKEGAQCCGITPAQNHIIYEIGRHPGIIVNDLAHMLGLEKSTISRHVQGLIESGIVKSLQSIEDKRYLNLNLTEQGLLINQSLTNSLAGYVVDIFNQIPEERRDQVNESLTLLLNAISKSPECCRRVI
ncbi:MarR family winged helix-turn-helix transcriptional regulator [Desulfosporosinus sp. BICA1-9]|uniref:MarR family winged helix-turn-helix transcriptional regulator n=1 Tax=Desulfosporosinus sp. BICA1-9 TaxID=1531958 RepID=UPI00054BD048|nr:MarR family winged helix-turn-helix transcriptional regulator [Desulfosporosinus sp. BICA1-9]KJS47494.1 MAG: hypothetical protein VR66_19360 [Peptococcaceae bacterium BRH_c23]KJS89316.1 MAG: hypothetical protein JL57_08165 [Desulfosporosinus sp. BICA1-9]KJS90703.1 MAG: hypothetical protein JL57_00350 [Desulfosporosinus sp. BICA1-9]HBW34454.1 MarR family transcriptional regulator [Desulfosporosinus sp.]